MKNFRIASFACLLAQIFLFSSAAHGFAEEKNLKNRLGIGYTSQIAVDANDTIPAIDVKYYMSKYSAVSAGVGFDTRSGDSRMGLGAKFYRNVFMESNLVFYMGVGFAYISHIATYLQASVFLGAEFFLPQLPSLGFSFETGIRGDDTTGSFAIRTTGDSFLTAGMHFYF